MAGLDRQAQTPCTTLRWPMTLMASAGCSATAPTPRPFQDHYVGMVRAGRHTEDLSRCLTAACRLRDSTA